MSAKNPQPPTASTDAEPKQGLSTAAFAAIVAALGLVLVVAVFFVATKVRDMGTASSCEQAKNDIRALIVRVGDPANLDTNPADSRLLESSADRLRTECSFYETVDFEAVEVFPWLGVDPTVDPNAPETSLPPAATGD